MSISIDPEAEAKRKQAEADAKSKLIADSLAIKMNRLSGTLNSIARLRTNANEGSSTGGVSSRLIGGALGYIASTNNTVSDVGNGGRPTTNVDITDWSESDKKYKTQNLNFYSINSNNTSEGTNSTYLFLANGLGNPNNLSNSVYNDLQTPVSTMGHIPQTNISSTESELMSAEVDRIVDEGITGINTLSYSNGGARQQYFLNEVLNNPNASDDTINEVTIASSITGNGDEWRNTIYSGIGEGWNFNIEFANNGLERNDDTGKWELSNYARNNNNQYAGGIDATTRNMAEENVEVITGGFADSESGTNSVSIADGKVTAEITGEKDENGNDIIKVTMDPNTENEHSVTFPAYERVSEETTQVEYKDRNGKSKTTQKKVTKYQNSENSTYTVTEYATPSNREDQTASHQDMVTLATDDYVTRMNAK